LLDHLNSDGFDCGNDGRFRRRLGDGGLVGLIALAIIIWLFSGRKITGTSSEGDVNNV
jgi:hypothetical protein